MPVFLDGFLREKWDMDLINIEQLCFWVTMKAYVVGKDNKCWSNSNSLSEYYNQKGLLYISTCSPEKPPGELSTWRLDKA